MIFKKIKYAYIDSFSFQVLWRDLMFCMKKIILKVNRKNRENASQVLMIAIFIATVDI